MNQALHHAPRKSPGGIFRTIGRVVGHGAWVLLPLLSVALLAWVPATQAYHRARTTGWLVTMVALMLCTAGFVAGVATDRPSLTAVTMLSAVPGGIAAAAVGRKVVFAPHDDAHAAVRTVRANRRRRRQARKIVENDPAMAVELGIGRPDRPGGYDDGGLVDLNNVPAETIEDVLGWAKETAAAVVSDRMARGGYVSVAEIGAFGGIDPRALEHDAERIVLLPFRPRG